MSSLSLGCCIGAFAAQLGSRRILAAEVVFTKNADLDQSPNSTRFIGFHCFRLLEEVFLRFFSELAEYLVRP